jgi:hypothetical protein
MEQLQRDKAAAVAAVSRLEAELADARREREAARGAAAAAEARLADMEQLQRDKAAALGAVQRLEVGAAASAASLAAARSQVPRSRPAVPCGRPARALPPTRAPGVRCALWNQPCEGAGSCNPAFCGPQSPRGCCRAHPGCAHGARARLSSPAGVQVAAMEQLQRDKAAAVAAVSRLEAELADARREREAARGAAAAAEARLADIDRLKREKAAALAAVQRLEVDAAAGAASLAAAQSQVPPAAPCRAWTHPQQSLCWESLDSARLAAAPLHAPRVIARAAGAMSVVGDTRGLADCL